MLSFTFYVLAVRARMLPGDFPAWQTVYTYFRRWRLDGTWLRIHRYLRDWMRLRFIRRTSPSVAIIDSQSVKIGVLSNNSVGAAHTRRSSSLTTGEATASRMVARISKVENAMY